MVDLRLLFVLVSIFCHTAVSNLSNCAVLCKGCTKCIGPALVKGKFGNYEAFVGIPYAAPPVGNLRFKDPQPPTSYPETLTLEEKPRCLQRNMYNWRLFTFGAEDCLYLNVYRPVNVAEPLPVFIYFPHSDFMYGTGARSEISPDIILNENSMIVVVVQFRVGLLGFFSTGDEHVPGNMGLKDQEMALNWVLDQIESFNGDPNRITVFGDATIMYHLNREDLLFERAIISGCYPMSYFREEGAFTQQEAAETAKKLAIAYEYGDIPMAELVEKMRTEKLAWMMDRMAELMGDFYFPYHIFGPTIEPESPSAFITESPNDMFREWNGLIPLMIGFSPFYGDQMIRGLENITYYSKHLDTREAVKKLVQLEPFAYHRLDDVIKHYNLKVMDEFHITKDYRHNYVEMMNDRYYAQPLQRLIYNYNENKHVKTKQLYIYEVMFDAPFNEGEVPHLFNNFNNNPNFEHNEEFLIMIRNFIEKGIARLETCVINDEHNSGVLCPHVKFFHDFLYDEYVWNTTAANFWNQLR